MRWWAAWFVIASASARLAFGQAEPAPDQLRKMYGDTLHQLQEAQDRKNQLAGENDKLNAKVVELQKQLDAAQAKLDESSRQAGEVVRRTYAERAEFAAWRAFLDHDPRVMREWELFLRQSTLAATTSGQLSDQLDANWPWSSAP
jgi:predicted  nucleic acid-binding Zn-ribbon protein